MCRYISVADDLVYDIKLGCYVERPHWLGTEPLKDTFTAIFNVNSWGSTETRSGPGSEHSRTQTLQRMLESLVRELQLQTMLDVPCGDFNWMRNVDLGGVDYLGADIVDDLVRVNHNTHARPGRRFAVLDVTRDPLPKVDLILCRDGLVHLSHDQVAQSIDNFKRSQSTYLLATTFAGTESNCDIASGWWRPLNLLRAPFNLPPPLRIISDAESDERYPDKTLTLWRLRDIAVAPCFTH